MAILKPKDVADRLGITTRTLQTWDRKGILKAKRSPTNRRFYTEDQIKNKLLMPEYQLLVKKMT